MNVKYYRRTSDPTLDRVNQWFHCIISIWYIFHFKAVFRVLASKVGSIKFVWAIRIRQRKLATTNNLAAQNLVTYLNLMTKETSLLDLFDNKENNLCTTNSLMYLKPCVLSCD